MGDIFICGQCGQRGQRGQLGQTLKTCPLCRSIILFLFCCQLPSLPFQVVYLCEWLCVCVHINLLSCLREERDEERKGGRKEGRVDKRKRFKSAEVVKLNGQTSELMMLKVEYILGVSTGWRLIIDHREPETSSYLGSFFSTFQKTVKI